MINVRKLQKEFLAAGINIGGCSENGIVWGVDGKEEIQERQDVAALIALHDSNLEEKPRPKNIPEEALSEAVELLKNKNGDMHLIVENLVAYISSMESRLKVVEKSNP